MGYGENRAGTVIFKCRRYIYRIKTASGGGSNPTGYKSYVHAQRVSLSISQSSSSEYPGGGGSSESPSAHGECSWASSSRMRAVNISFRFPMGRSGSSADDPDPVLFVLRVDKSRFLCGPRVEGVRISKSSEAIIFSCAARNSFCKYCRRTVLTLRAFELTGALRWGKDTEVAGERMETGNAVKRSCRRRRRRRWSQSRNMASDMMEQIPRTMPMMAPMGRVFLGELPMSGKIPPTGLGFWLTGAWMLEPT